MNYIFSNQTDKRHQNRDSTNYLVFVACHRINTALTFFHPFLAILEKTNNYHDKQYTNRECCNDGYALKTIQRVLSKEKTYRKEY